MQARAMVRVLAILAVVGTSYVTVRWYKRLPPANQRRARYGVLVVTLTVALAVLVATGRLHWLTAAAASLLFVVKRLAMLLPSLPILQRFLERRSTKRSRNVEGASGSMTIEQARSILELGPNAAPADVIAAHRRLMTKLHPDTGGSTYLAAQINQARDLLLGRA